MQLDNLKPFTGYSYRFFWHHPIITQLNSCDSTLFVENLDYSFLLILTKKSCTSFGFGHKNEKFIYLFLHLIVEDKEIADDLTGAANGHARLIPEEDAEVAAELTEQPPAEPEEKKPEE